MSAEEWLSSREVRHADLRSDPPGNAIVEWASMGLIKSRARAVRGANWDAGGDGFIPLPQSFWGAAASLTGSAYRKWDVGTFVAWFRRGIRDGHDEVTAYQVQFSKADVAQLAGPMPSLIVQPAPAPAKTDPATKKGRPRAGEGTWETELFGDLLGLATGGGWLPGGTFGIDRGGQAEIERKIADWLSEHDFEVPANSTVAGIAARLLVMLKAIRKAGG